MSTLQTHYVNGESFQTLLYKLNVTPSHTLSFNQENVKMQIANISQLTTQYLNPIYIGAMKDVDTAFNQLQSNLKAAGLGQVNAEEQKQAQAYLSSKSK